MNFFQWIRDFKKGMFFLSSLGVKPINFFIPSFFALAASVFEGASFALLAPTIQGLISFDFSFVFRLKIVGFFFQALPKAWISKNQNIFISLVLLIFVSAILKNLFLYLSLVGVSKQVRSFSHELRAKIFRVILGFNKSFFDKNSTGHLQNILIGYTEQIATAFKSLHSAVYSIFSLVIYLTIMFWISWKVTFAVLLFFPLLTVCAQKLIIQIQQGSARFSQFFSLLGKKISNALACMPLIKACSSETTEEEFFLKVSSDVRNAQYSMDKRFSFIPSMQELFMVCTMLTLIGFMAFVTMRYREGGVSYWLVYFVVIRRAYGGIGGINLVQSMIASVSGPLNEVGAVFENKDTFKETSGSVPFSEFCEKIEFKKLSFSYSGNHVLKGISFEIKKGEMVAIVGETGSGKTTIAQLLMGFYEPPPNSLILDGRDIRCYRLKDIRSKIAYVPQDSYLFDATINMNLRYGCSSPLSDVDIFNVVKQVQLSDFISNLPLGLETEIGERGIRLSGGEKQRLSLARAILRAPEILILDEATSAMDSHTEQLVQKAIVASVQGRTSIVIAHRLNTIAKADKVVVIDGGQVVEVGRFEDLIKSSTHFRRYWDAHNLS